ncbi:HAD-IA family hydrolase [Nocardioides sp.]|uniref:HAD-IA family hydrolase n=1 Tax=Nocardioides sp. TaxID=35761 RepID=UPI0035270B42
MGASLPALVFDFGGPVLLTPFELVEELGPDAPAYRLLHGRGPMAPPDQPDADWVGVLTGAITERTYWDHRAAEWGELGGGGGSIRDMIAHLYDPPQPWLVREGAVKLIHDARVAGHPIGVLTNDLHAFHSDEWVAQMHVLDDVDVLVDGSIEGHLKPHPRLYELMSERLGVGFGDMVFVDDMPVNIRGAEALGIRSVSLDPRDPEAAYAELRGLLGLP